MAATPNAVYISNISRDTTDEGLTNFFAFCGPISKITVNTPEQGPQSAVIFFEQAAGAHTAVV